MSVTFLLITVMLAAGSSPVQGALRPPAEVAAVDSVSSAAEKGIELIRFTQYAGWNQRVDANGRALAYVKWRTDQRFADQDVDRIRQDGRWYAGGTRRGLSMLDFWVGAEGEHFDDRPKRTHSKPGDKADLQPRDAGIVTEPLKLIQTAASAVRILRGGGGIVLTPLRGVRATVGSGAVEDRRIARVENGLGVWSSMRADSIMIGGYEQHASAEYNRETPRNHANTDLMGRYQVYREFFPGNSNRADAAGTLYRRDIYLDASDLLSRRKDEHYEIRDVLNYQVHRLLDAEFSGEIEHDRTTQAGAGSADFKLEENQTGFGAKLAARSSDYAGTLGIDLRQVTQTIRGEVLQGLKTDLLLNGSAPAPLSSRLRLRLLVSKYRLDTRSESNHDDRDELRYTGEAVWTKPLFTTMIFEWHGSVMLDHLVYVFAENSANNRWTRYLVTGTRLRYRPAASIDNFLRANVSANYSDYDFETNSRTTRSTVFRRLTLGDSTRVQVSGRTAARFNVAGQIEEFGRLYWDSFEEERSDETRSYSASAEAVFTLNPRDEIAAGGLWDSRRSLRFPEHVGDPELVYQEYQTYGPVGSLRHEGAQLTIRISARALRQLRLEQPDRWLYTGEAVVAWRF
ncbi:hypothetical protein HZB60_01450 [candidate division KSB1 bacterium]|nr:hypothetical protein [candidate division KSB1 bacterium]